MMQNQATRNGLTRKAVKVVASIARRIAHDGIDGRCFVILHQPRIPKDLDERLKMLKKD